MPPLIEERLAYFDPKRIPSTNTPLPDVHRAAKRRAGGNHRGIVNDRHNLVHGELAGGWGFFECIDDEGRGRALLAAAEDWNRLQGMDIIRGPLNFSMNDEVGTLIDGFDTPPMVMMTHNPRYYPRLIEAAGYVKAMDLYAWLSRSSRGSPRPRRSCSGWHTRPWKAKVCACARST